MKVDDRGERPKSAFDDCKAINLGPKCFFQSVLFFSRKKQVLILLCSTTYNSTAHSLNAYSLCLTDCSHHTVGIFDCEWNCSQGIANFLRLNNKALLLLPCEFYYHPYLKGLWNSKPSNCLEIQALQRPQFSYVKLILLNVSNLNCDVFQTSNFESLQLQGCMVTLWKSMICDLEKRGVLGGTLN